jgi:uncharacterized protein (DUF58 family)
MATRSLEEILHEVRRIQIVARRQVNDLLAGEYLSAFKGRGMEFESVREYVPGDDIRTIDWNVTARSNAPHVKTFCEERELTVFLAIDVSASSFFGSKRLSKLETAVEIAAVLMFASLKSNDKVGLIFFADEVLRFVPPRKGRGNVLRLIREMLAVEPVKKETNIGKALEYLQRIQRRRCVVFLLSDFIGEGWLSPLSIASSKHDCIAVTISDPREAELPDMGIISLQDAETGRVLEVDTRIPRIRQWFATQARAREAKLVESLRSAQVDRLDIRTDQPYSKSLQKFFRTREHQR